MRCPTLAELPPPSAGTVEWPWTEESPQLPETTADGSSWPLVSIVTPSYNQAPFIEETMRSVLLQGYPNMEYLVIDGGSTDGSVDIIRKYEPWLAYWVSERDNGQSQAINKGWRRSHGSVVAWLNSDDTYLPGAIGRAVEFFRSHPAVALAYSDYCFTDEHGRRIQVLEVADFDMWSELRHNIIPQPATFLRREALDAVGMLDEDLHFAMDYDLWIRIGRRFPIQHVPDFWATFRVCAGTKSVSQAEASFREARRVVERHLSDPAFAATVGMTTKDAWSLAHLDEGLRCYELCNMPAARHHLLHAIRWRPEVASRPQVLSCLLKSLLGGPLIATARRWSRRPPADGHGGGPAATIV